MMEKLRQTPSQTVGPFFAYGLTARQYGYDYTSIIDGSLVSDYTDEEQIYITGSVFDGDGKPIPDAMIELCQPDRNGHYRNSPIEQNNTDFKGFGRLGTGTRTDNRFVFTTVKPGSMRGQPPHINIILFMRGSLRHLYTRLYFSDEENDNDPLLKSIDAHRSKTLIAQRIPSSKGIEYRFDIYMQGEKETVFFEV